MKKDLKNTGIFKYNLLELVPVPIWVDQLCNNFFKSIPKF